MSPGECRASSHSEVLAARCSAAVATRSDVPGRLQEVMGQLDPQMMSPRLGSLLEGSYDDTIYCCRTVSSGNTRWLSRLWVV